MNVSKFAIHLRFTGNILEFWNHTVMILAWQYAFLVYAHPLISKVHFWLHHTAHCAEKLVSACLCAGPGKGGTGGG